MDGKRSCLSGDYISHMPDEILISILSYLPVEEAARTSIIARRWRSLWPFPVRDLNFEASERELRWLAFYNEFKIEDRRARFIRRVNSILELHRQCTTTTIQRLRLRFFLGQSNAPDIDAWLQFAFAKGVKSLELDFRTSAGNSHSDRYNFPKIPLPLQSFASLETLQLTCVNVSGQVLEYFISNCPSLQLLRVAKSTGLVDLKVNGSLKHLELRFWPRMRNLAIRAPGLLSLDCIGPVENFVIEDISHLVKLCLSIRSWSVAQSIMPFHSCFTYLEELMLVDASAHDKSWGLEHIGPPISFPSLRKLVFDVQAYGLEGVLMYSSSLLKAAPKLEEFRLELYWAKAQGGETLRFEDEPHRCLKKVEITGFAGGTADEEIAKYFLKIGISIERMNIHPTKSLVEEICWYFTGDAKREAIDRATKKLKAKLSPETTLDIDEILHFITT